MRSRPFLTRLLVAAGGMLLLCLGIYVGLGYAVHRKFPWLGKVLDGDRIFALEMAYMRALGTAFPRDSDGDGFPDSAESYIYRNPNNPNDHPSAWVVTTEWVVRVTGDDGYSSNVPNFLLQAGERAHVRGRLEYNEQRLVFSPGMTLAVGTGLVNDPPHIVPLAVGGSCKFDIAVPGEEVIPNLGALQIVVGDPAGTELFAILDVAVVRKLPPIPCTTANFATDDGLRAKLRSELRTKAEFSVVRLTWPAVSDTGVLYIEAMDADSKKDELKREWFPVAVCRPDASTCVLAYRPTESRTSLHGALKFRVVPTKSTPAEP